MIANPSRANQMSATMNKMGRKKLPAELKASERLQIRITKRDLATLKKASQIDGKPLSTWALEEMMRIAHRKLRK